MEGWAYGDSGTALAGKDCLWAVASGGDQSVSRVRARAEQTARFCAMKALISY